jgi:ribosomal protein S18 acetylase RimI-like enzyme
MIQLLPWPELPADGKAAVRGLEVSSIQLEYAGTVDAAVAQAQEGPPHELMGLAIVAGSSVVGFLLLKSGSKVPQWASPDTAVVSGLRIGAHFQGQGLGTQALRALPGWIERHWPHARSIALSVDEENHAAIRSYAKAGWVDHGVREPGRIGWVRYMSRPLASTGTDG